MISGILCYLPSPLFAASPGPYVAARAGTSIEGFTSNRIWSDLVGRTDSFYDHSDSAALMAAAAAAGYAFEAPFRVEVEYAYRGQFQHDKRPTNNGSHNVNIDTTTQTLMLNGYFEFREMSKVFTPFLSAGIGWARHSTDASAYPTGATAYYESRGQEIDRFAWAVGCGVGFALSDRLALDVSYRYIDLGEGAWENYAAATGDAGHYRADLSAHEIFAGLRYAF
ncbi:MAG: outer membrane protein [Rhodospirillaceae bacterium]